MIRLKNKIRSGELWHSDWYTN